MFFGCVLRDISIETPCVRRAGARRPRLTWRQSCAGVTRPAICTLWRMRKWRRVLLRVFGAGKDSGVRLQNADISVAWRGRLILSEIQEQGNGCIIKYDIYIWTFWISNADFTWLWNTFVNRTVSHRLWNNWILFAII